MSVLWENVRSFRLMGEVRECAVLALFNLRGGSSGAVLDPAAARVRPVADPGRPRPPSDPPTVGLYHHDEGSSAIESAGWLRYLLDNVWRLPYRELDAAAIAAGGLKGTEVLLVPNGSETDAADEHPFATDLARRLRDRGLPVRAFSLR